MIIVISHFEFLGNDGAFGEFYDRYLHNATLGVDFFFMLSGFGMMLSWMRKDKVENDKVTPKDLLNFGVRHVIKIYPIYIITCLTMIPFVWIESTQHVVSGFQLVKVIGKIFAFLLADITLLQSATGSTIFSHELNNVCWFLSSLFCIYLISPLIMRFLKRHIRNIKAAWLGVVSSICISTLLAVVLDWIQQKTIFNDLTYGSPYRRVFYVVTGMLLAYIYVFTNRSQKAKLVSSSREYIWILAAIFWFITRNSVAPSISYGAYIIDMIIVAGVLYSLSFEVGGISKFLASKKLIYLGNISMYIFLIHFPLKMYSNMICQTIGEDSLTIELVEVFIVLFLTFCLSMYVDRIRTRKVALSSKRK